MTQLQYKSSSYWYDVRPERESEFLDMVLAIEPILAPRQDRTPMTTHAEVLDYLTTHRDIRYGGAWYAQLRIRPEPAPVSHPTVSAAVPMVRCDCGHTVPRSQVMMASLGTSCPACYDAMSDSDY
jgi:hypothetical protein